MSDLVLYEQRGDTAWLTMNRPEVRNALSREHVIAIREAIERACDADGVRAIVLAGADPVFCAGADVRQYQNIEDRHEVYQDGAVLYDLLDYMMRSEKPIIARIQRAAFGGAIGLVCACDIAVASEGTRFSLSEARLGIVPAVISQAVITSLGPRNARQLMLRAEAVTPEEALRVGLVQDVVPEADLDDAIEEFVNQLRQSAPGAQAEIKRLLHALTHTLPDPVARREMILDLAAERRASVEGQEGLRAFTEKRAPAWARHDTLEG